MRKTTDLIFIPDRQSWPNHYAAARPHKPLQAYHHLDYQTNDHYEASARLFPPRRYQRSLSER